MFELIVNCEKKKEKKKTAQVIIKLKSFYLWTLILRDFIFPKQKYDTQLYIFVSS